MKDIVVKGRIPRSIREQVKRPRKTRNTFKNKKIKKIKLPKRTTDMSAKNTIPGQTPNLKSSIRRNKNKTFKKVRFNLDSTGIQPGKFSNPTRTRMKNKTSKAKPFIPTKNNTQKRSFKVRYLEEQEQEQENKDVPKLNLLDNLKDVEDILTEDITIVHI